MFCVYDNHTIFLVLPLKVSLMLDSLQTYAYFEEYDNKSSSKMCI